jgi:hypothetical protein
MLLCRVYRQPRRVLWLCGIAFENRGQGAKDQGKHESFFMLAPTPADLGGGNWGNRPV